MSRTFFFLSISALLLTGSLAFAQQCENGVCRFPVSGAEAYQQNEWNRNVADDFRWGIRRKESPGPANARWTSGGQQISRCPVCDCNGDYCTCGPNCPTHYQATPGQPFRNERLRDTFRPGSSESFPRPGFLTAPSPRENLFAPVSYSRSINWETDYRTAAALAQRSNRPMFVKIGAEWCGHCRRMQTETFSDSRIIHDIDTAFVAVSLNADADRQLLQRMQVRSLPTILVMSPELRIVDRVEGFQSSSQLSDLLSRHLLRARLETGARVACR